MRKKTLLFVYDFPHSKSVDFIDKCVSEGIKIELIVGASFKNIKKTRRLFNFHKYNKTIIHPKKLATKFNIPYYNCDHNSLELEKIMKDFDINFGIIAGARILSKKIIEKFYYGVLNIHPGVLPFNRGLDSILWAIHDNKKIGISAHLINEKIDLGELVLSKIIEPIKFDNIFDIYRKVHKAQIELLPLAYNLIEKKSSFKFLTNGFYHTYMPKELQKKTLNNLEMYITNYSKIK